MHWLNISSLIGDFNRQEPTYWLAAIDLCNGVGAPWIAKTQAYRSYTNAASPCIHTSRDVLWSVYERSKWSNPVWYFVVGNLFYWRVRYLVHTTSHSGITRCNHSLPDNPSLRIGYAGYALCLRACPCVFFASVHACVIVRACGHVCVRHSSCVRACMCAS